MLNFLLGVLIGSSGSHGATVTYTAAERLEFAQCLYTGMTTSIIVTAWIFITMFVVVMWQTLGAEPSYTDCAGPR